MRGCWCWWRWQGRSRAGLDRSYGCGCGCGGGCWCDLDWRGIASLCSLRGVRGRLRCVSGRCRRLFPPHRSNEPLSRVFCDNQLCRRCKQLGSAWPAQVQPARRAVWTSEATEARGAARRVCQPVRVSRPFARLAGLAGIVRCVGHANTLAEVGSVSSYFGRSVENWDATSNSVSSRPAYTPSARGQ